MNIQPTCKLQVQCPIKVFLLLTFLEEPFENVAEIYAAAASPFRNFNVRRRLRRRLERGAAQISSKLIRPRARALLQLVILIVRLKAFESVVNVL